MSYIIGPRQSEDERSQKVVGKIADRLITGFGAGVLYFSLLFLGKNFDWELVCAGMVIIIFFYREWERGRKNK